MRQSVRTEDVPCQGRWAQCLVTEKRIICFLGFVPCQPPQALLGVGHTFTGLGRKRAFFSGLPETRCYSGCAQLEAGLIFLFQWTLVCIECLFTLGFCCIFKIFRISTITYFTRVMQCSCWGCWDPREAAVRSAGPGWSTGGPLCTHNHSLLPPAGIEPMPLLWRCHTFLESLLIWRACCLGSPESEL